MSTAATTPPPPDNNPKSAPTNAAAPAAAPRNNGPQLPDDASAISPSNSFPSAASIKGHQSESGTMTIDYDSDTNNRLRANTAPTVLSTASAVAETAVATAVDSDVTKKEEEEDEEIKLAMAMALAIQNNPHLTPDEIHQLIGQQQPAAAATATATPQNQRLFTSIFQNNETTKKGGFHVFREKAEKRISEIKMATEKLPFATRTTTPKKVETNDDETDETKAAAATTTTVKQTNGEQDQGESAKNVRPDDAAVTPAISIPVDRSNKNAAEIKTAAAAAAAQTKESSGTKQIEETNTAAATSSSDSTATTNVKPTADAATASFLGITEAVTATAKNAAVLTQSMLEKNPVFRQPLQQQQQQQPKPRLTGIAWKRRGGMGKYSTTSAWERRRIALTGTKLLYYLVDNNNNSNKDESLSTDEEDDSAKDYIPATETRRSISWFETTGMAWPTTMTLEPDESTPRGFIDLAKEKATVNAAFGHSGAPTPFALSIKVKAETKWKLCFDRHSVCMEWLAAITDVVMQCSADMYNAALLEAADPSNAAVVLANDHGNYFALFNPPTDGGGPASRQQGPGKAHRLWMLEKYRIQSDDYFDSNDSDSTTDGERQKAVDTGKPKMSTVVEQTEEEETVREIVQQQESDLDHKAAQESAHEDAAKSLVLPQENLLYAVAVINFAMILARASSTTVDGFWRILVFSNLAVFLCLVEHPDWRSILARVRAVPTSCSGAHLLQRVSLKKQRKDETTSIVPFPAVDQLPPVPFAKPKSSYIPHAGSSAVKLDEPTDPPKNEKGEMFAGWRPMPGETLLVRSHGYAETKRKVASPGELYECVAVDVFESPQRYPDMGPRVKLPTVDFDDDGKAPKTWRSPDIFIISIALPTDPPKMGRSSSDGGGYTVTMYYRMKRETREILRRVTADGYDPSTEKVDDPQKSKVNAVRLLEEWIRRSPSDPKFQARFKVVPNAHNLKEIGMPGWISKYNGKPFLIKRAGVTGFLAIHPELSCVEFDISLHPFPYLAKQGICFMKESYFKKVLVTFGFVIEGRTDDELPECLIGLMQLCYPDPQYAIQAEDFFNGTAPRSL